MELCLSFPLILTDRWSEFAHLDVLECGMDNVILTPDLLKKQDHSAWPIYYCGCAEASQAIDILYTEYENIQELLNGFDK